MAQRITEINWDWVESHINEDPIKLRLKKDAAAHMLDIVQIECRKKAGKKLSKTLEHNPRFIFGNTLASEQSTSDMLAQYHATLIPEGAKVCDLTSGLGIDVLYLAQRASSVTAIELQPELCEALEINAGIDSRIKGKIKVICGDCREVLKEICEKEGKDKPFDVIFIDPARRSSTGKRLFSLHDCQPDVVEMIPLIRQACHTLIIKMSPMLDITQVWRELPSVSQIIVLGTNRECKELIAICKWDKPENEEVEISVVSLLNIEKEESPGDETMKEERGIKSESHNNAQYESVSSGLERRGFVYGEGVSLEEKIITQSNESIKGVSTEYLSALSSMIKVNKFSFYPSEESSITEVKYVDIQFIQHWMSLLDEESLRANPTNNKIYSYTKEEKNKGMSTAHPFVEDIIQDYRNEDEFDLNQNIANEDNSSDSLRRKDFQIEDNSLYLYEPSPSMMKAGAYQLVARRFSLMMMGSNSHLYLCESLKVEFPGSFWKVEGIYPLNSSTIKTLAKQNLKGEVAVRNYPMAAEALRKKLKVENGVGKRYMATTTNDNKAFLFELASVD